jgi:hypothetical protein
MLMFRLRLFSLYFLVLLHLIRLDWEGETSTRILFAAAADDEDAKEVERILGATEIIQQITKQREKHRLQLMEIEKNMETEIKEFYKKHDAALSKLRTVDADLRQRVNNLESKVIAEAQNLKDVAPSYASWLMPFLGMSSVVVGVYMWLGRVLSKTVA